MARPDAVFQGDDESMVDRLVAACQSAKFASPPRPELIGRDLVAVDCAWLEAPLPPHVAAQYERPNATKPQQQQRPRPSSSSAPTSPGRGKAPAKGTSQLTSPAGSVSGGGAAGPMLKKAGRTNSGRPAAAAAASPPAGSPLRPARASKPAAVPAAAASSPASPPRRRRSSAAAPTPVAGDACGTGPASGSPRNGSPACPGHFRSPQPHLLPAPTTSLLLRAANSSSKALTEMQVQPPCFPSCQDGLALFASQTVHPAAA